MFCSDLFGNFELFFLYRSFSEFFMIYELYGDFIVLVSKYYIEVYRNSFVVDSVYKLKFLYEKFNLML